MCNPCHRTFLLPISPAGHLLHLLSRPRRPHRRTLCLPARGKLNQLPQGGIVIKKVIHSHDIWHFFFIMPCAAKKLPFSTRSGNKEYGLCAFKYVAADICWRFHDG